MFIALLITMIFYIEPICSITWLTWIIVVPIILIRRWIKKSYKDSSDEQINNNFISHRTKLKVPTFDSFIKNIEKSNVEEKHIPSKNSSKNNKNEI
jgi:hypothetical protein